MNGDSFAVVDPLFCHLHSDPPVFLSERPVYYGYYYGTAELSCVVLADPPATIDWISKQRLSSQDYFSINNDTVNSSILEVMQMDFY